LRLTNLIGRKNWNMSPRGKPSVLIGISIHGIVDEISTDAAVIQQSISFTGRTVAYYGFSITLGLD